MGDEMKHVAIKRDEAFNEFKATALRLAENARLLHRKRCEGCQRWQFCEERSALDGLVALLERSNGSGGSG